MNPTLKSYKKATSLVQVDNAVRLDVPITPEHPFYTDFSDVRGDFEDMMVYGTLNVNAKTFVYNREANNGNKVTLYLAGMRGSGKTTELAKISQKLHNKDCFFCVTCNLDEGLDINDMEYVDILIFQLERLFEELQKHEIQPRMEIVTSLNHWFAERVKEVNQLTKDDLAVETEVGAETPSFFGFLKISAKLKASLQSGTERAEKIRTPFKNNFTHFAQKFNEFIEGVNMELRRLGIAQELLFIVDGLEKVATSDIRKKLVLDEANRIKQIKVNTIFTLPIELKPECQRLMSNSDVVSFPFVKLRERNNTIIEEAMSRFMEFVYKHIDASLFDSPETVRLAILYSGGSPRELLRILKYANIFADDDSNIITLADLQKGVKKLAAQTSQYVSKRDLEMLKELKEANEAGITVAFDSEWQDLLEKQIVLEYNDGTYKRVNPLVEISAIYQQYVGQ